MRICTREELKGVIGHELSHVTNHDILTSSIAATLAGAVMMIGTMIRWGAIFGLGNRDDEEGGIAGLLIAGILAPIAATLIQLAISRTREYQADASGPSSRIILCTWPARSANSKLPTSGCRSTPAPRRLTCLS